MSTVVTLRLEAEAQAFFDRLRTMHYPPALNRIGAHVTLFHTLPATAAIADALRSSAAACRAMELRVTGLRSLGRGVAYTLASEELGALHAELTEAFADEVMAQDRQRFKPHIVVQNKTTPEQARVLLAALESDFRPWTIRGEGLDWWDYLGGPWALRETFPFS